MNAHMCREEWDLYNGNFFFINKRHVYQYPVSLYPGCQLAISKKLHTDAVVRDRFTQSPRSDTWTKLYEIYTIKKMKKIWIDWFFSFYILMHNAEHKRRGKFTCISQVPRTRISSSECFGSLPFLLMLSALIKEKNTNDTCRTKLAIHRHHLH